MSTKNQKPGKTTLPAINAEAILGAFPDTFVVLHANGRIIQAHIGKNESCIADKNVTQAVKKNLGQVLDRSLAKKITESIKKDLPGKRTSIFETVINIDDTRYLLEIRLRKMQEETVLVIVRNITRLFSNTDQKEKFYNITEQSQELIMVTDVTGMIEYVNPMLTKVTGYTSRELVGKNARIFRTGKHSADFYFKLWSTILEGRSYKAEFYNSKKNGDQYVEEKTITPLYNAEGQITNFISTGIDITLEKRNEQKAIKYKQLQVTIDKKEQKSRTLSLIKSNEIERNKFAREIHEGVNQMLSAAMANLESLSAKKVISSEEKSRIELINQMVSEITQELRGISSSLSPISLYEFGLFLAIEQVVMRTNAANKNLKIHFTSNLQRVRFKTEIEINVYRIIQEAIKNILQHAAARKIVVSLEYNNNNLCLTVKDNGKGISMNSLEFKKISTFGILNMEARARSIGAELTIRSSKDKGFIINLKLNTKIKIHD